MATAFERNLSVLIDGAKSDLVQIQTADELEIRLGQLVDAASRSSPAYYQDKLVYRITVSILGFAIIIVALAQWNLAYNGLNKDMPQGLVALGSAAIGALAGLLAPVITSGSKDNGIK